MIESLFAALGINTTESNIYLALAELGKAPASVLAKKLELPRSTVYTALESLEKHGLTSKEKLAEVALFQASPAEAILEMVQNEKAKNQKILHDKEHTAKELIPLLSSHFQNKNFSVPRLEFFEGSSGIKKMLLKYQDTWQQSIANYDYTWWGYQDHHFVESYRDWLDKYWASMKEEEKICLFSNQSETEKRLKRKISKRSIKTIKKEFEFSSTIWILGDYVVTIMTRQQPHYAFQLHDSVFAANQRLIFQMLWLNL